MFHKLTNWHCQWYGSELVRSSSAWLSYINRTNLVDMGTDARLWNNVVSARLLFFFCWYIFCASQTASLLLWLLLVFAGIGLLCATVASWKFMVICPGDWTKKGRQTHTNALDVRRQEMWARARALPKGDRKHTSPSRANLFSAEINLYRFPNARVQCECVDSQVSQFFFLSLFWLCCVRTAYGK